MLLLKIEEDVLVHDDVIHPFVTPGRDRYNYTITNVNFDSGNVGYNFVPQFGVGDAIAGVGVNGVSGFNIQNIFGVVVLAQGQPPFDPVTGIAWAQNCCAGPGNIEWDIIPPGNGVGAPVAGSPPAQNNFWFEVTAGVPHGVLPIWVHSWSATPSQVNLMTGFVSGPVPEPGTLALCALGLAGLALEAKRRRQSATGS